MSNKPRMVEVTDPVEIEALTRDKSDLGVPFTFSPNGHPWVDPDELALWRASQTTSEGLPK